MATTRAPSGSTDPMFDVPDVDVDEWRDEPVRHRYVHGGFRGTDARFAMHLPPEQRYDGRFFHPIFAIPGNEHTVSNGFMPGTAGWIPFAVASGAYLVESNQGRLDRRVTAQRKGDPKAYGRIRNLARVRVVVR
ncbi:MAG: hypothetical protein ACHQNA_08670 [Acidimicrobiales bacterium]